MARAFRLQIDEPGSASRVVVIELPVEVGRECDGIVLDDPTASRRHVSLDPTDEGLVLADLGSSNGTIAGGEVIDGPMLLQPGAWFQVGETRIVVHEARDGDHHVIDAQQAGTAEVADRPSEAHRELGQAAAHTQKFTR